MYARFILGVLLPLYGLLGYSAGCFMFCTREAYNASGGYPEEYYGGEDEPARYELRRGLGVDAPTEDVFHLSTPAARWWDNVIFACSSFQPFRSAAEVDRWCREHDLPRGASMSIPALWLFARDWYGGYLSDPWRKRSPAEAAALFTKHGLVGEFWQLD